VPATYVKIKYISSTHFKVGRKLYIDKEINDESFLTVRENHKIKKTNIHRSCTFYANIFWCF